MSVIQVRSITCLMRAFRSPAGTPLILATNVEVLDDGHVRVERRRFRQVAGAPFCFDRLIEHVEAGDDGLAVGGRHVAGENPHGGRLAGAVRAEKSEDFTALDAEADVVDGSKPTVPLREALDLDQGSFSWWKESAVWAAPAKNRNLRRPEVSCL